MSRRLTILLNLLLVLALLISACGPAGSGEAVEVEPETAAEEEAPSDTEEAEPADGQPDLQSPIEYPEGELPVTGEETGEAEAVSLDQILTYRTLDSYEQPEWMDALVEDGTLPPVEERLPTEPQVLLASGMQDGLGEYGGIWRDFSGSPTEGWNLCAGQSGGYYGVHAIYSESLVVTGPIYRRDTVEPLPNLAKSWEWSEDGTELTMELIEGAKWSDGDPFDAEDVIFTWEDIILDPNVNSWSNRSLWQIDGEDITLEQVDEYTVRWTFPTSRPVQTLFNMDLYEFTVCPAHYMKSLHPTYNEDTDYTAFAESMPPNQLPVPTLGPWVPVEYETDQFLVMRRNPYYWKVDEEGRQLPYINEVTFEKGSGGLGRTLGTLAGSLDHSNLENPSSYVEATRRLQEEDAHFRIAWGPEALSFPLVLNLSANLGVENDRDQALRELFRDFRFRRALSHAVDREGVAQAIIRGPFLRGFPGGLYPGAAEYDRESVVYYSYHPDSTRALLADIGFEDTDGNGVLNWTEGPLEGEDLVFSLISSEEAPATNQVGDALVALFGEVGIRVNHRILQSPSIGEAIESGTWEMQVQRGDQEYLVPFTRCQDLAPISSSAPDWHYEGAEPRELLDFEEEMIEIVNEFCREADPERRNELMFEYNQLFTENVYIVGTVIGRYGLALAQRFSNIPAGAPPFFYQWTWSNIMGEQVWVAAEEQLGETMPNMIPVDYPDPSE